MLKFSKLRGCLVKHCTFNIVQLWYMKIKLNFAVLSETKVVQTEWNLINFQNSKLIIGNKVVQCCMICKIHKLFQFLQSFSDKSTKNKFLQANKILTSFCTKNESFLQVTNAIKTSSFCNTITKSTEINFLKCLMLFYKTILHSFLK